MQTKIWIISFWILVLSAPVTYAHQVSVFGWVDGDRIFVEGRISGGKRPIGAKIQVLDRQGKLLHEGITDHQGDYQFKIPESTDLSIILNAGLGHRAEWTISREELSASGGNSYSHPREKNESSYPSPSNDPAPPVKFDPLTAADVERIVDRALERKLKPLIAELSKSRHTGPDVKDVLGGIGYILGLIGLVAYLRNRKNQGK